MLSTLTFASVVGAAVASVMPPIGDATPWALVTSFPSPLYTPSTGTFACVDYDGYSVNCFFINGYNFFMQAKDIKGPYAWYNWTSGISPSSTGGEWYAAADSTGRVWSMSNNDIFQSMDTLAQLWAPAPFPNVTGGLNSYFVPPSTMVVTQFIGSPYPDPHFAAVLQAIDVQNLAEGWRNIPTPPGAVGPLATAYYASLNGCLYWLSAMNYTSSLSTTFARLNLADPNGAWELLPSPSYPRIKVASVACGGKIWAIGGAYGTLPSEEDWIDPVSTVETYDPESEAWTVESPLLDPVSSASATCTDSTGIGGSILVYGGVAGTSIYALTNGTYVIPRPEEI